MKKLILLLFTPLLFLTLACEKDPGDNPGQCKDKSTHVATDCDIDFVGYVGKMDCSVSRYCEPWVLRNYYGGSSSPFFPVPQVYLKPINLPKEFKVSGTSVEVSMRFTGVVDSCFVEYNEAYYKVEIKEVEICSIEEHEGPIFVPMKPAIYLYPEEETDVNVKLEYEGELTFTYPDYDNNIKGWDVTAEPNGRLLNKADGMEYQYLFWEGEQNNIPEYDLSQGYVVKGSDTKDFLQNMLPKLGLEPKEYNEMIVFWLPKLKDNPYNLIHFAEEKYTDTAPLTITPEPDNMIRVFMVTKLLETFIEVEPQEIKPFCREGFTVVEWGGGIIPEDPS